MLWPFPPPRRRDVLLAVVIVALAGAYLAVMNLHQPNAVNWGFGPEWECANNGQGEPVCVKKVSAHPGSTTTSN